MAQSKKTDAEVEVGTEFGIGPMLPGASWSEWGGDTAGANVVINRPIVTIDQIIDMRRRDGQARALIQLVTLPLRLALQTGEWIEPDDGDAEKETEFANQMWTLPPTAGGMTTPQSKLVRQMLLSVTDGFAPFEIVRQCPEIGPLKGKYTLQKLAYRDPRTVKFKVDRNGGYAGFRQIAKDGDGNVVDVTLKPRKTLVITQHDELNPHYGVSFFESAYPHFDAKRKLYYIAHLAAQFAAVPGLVGEVPMNPKRGELVAFREALMNFAFNTKMVAPPGYKVTPVNGHTGFNFLDLINHHNSQMSKSILAPFFDSEQRTVLIENSSSDAGADLFLSNIETIANDIAEALTHYLMPQFIDFNFDTHKYPVFKPGALSDSQKSSIAEMFSKVVVSGILNSTPEFVRELEKKVSDDLGLDIDYEEIEKREKEAAEQQAAQAEQEAAQQAAAPTAPGEEENGGGPTAPADAATPEASGQAPNPAQVAAAAQTVDDLVLAAQAIFDAPDQAPPFAVDEGI